MEKSLDKFKKNKHRVTETQKQKTRKELKPLAEPAIILSPLPTEILTKFGREPRSAEKLWIN
jgi:hypothetical protein